MTSHLLPTYARVHLAFERGEGVWLVATNGERYLDFTSGVAVNALGHAHPHMIAALTAQAQKLWHVSNLYEVPEAERVAQRLCDVSFADVVFFCNSGAEAMECTIKMARKYHSANGAPERYRIITFEGAFHGRTLATLAAGGQKKYLDGFGPVMEGFDQVPFGNLEATKAAITPETGAILIEPIMGEGGVRVVEPSFLRALRELCDQHGLLLLLDEVQTGMGRTGELFAHQRSGIEPDIMALAKALGGGFPVGACLARREAAKGMTVGTHGSTFGGNPLAAAVGLEALRIIADEALVERSRVLGAHMIERLRAMTSPVLKAVRGRGLWAAAEIDPRFATAREVCERLVERGVLSKETHRTVVRLAPPLVITREDLDLALDRLEEVIGEFERARPRRPQRPRKRLVAA